MNEDDEANDPLQALMVDGEKIDKELIVKALSGIAGLNKSGEVVQLAGFSALSARQKILTYLLAYKAAEILGLRSEHTARSADLARSIGIAEGTVYPTVSELRGDHSISQDSDSKCFIAHHQVASATTEISTKTARGTKSSAGGSGQRTKSRPTKAAKAPASPDRSKPSSKPDATRADSDESTSPAATSPTRQRSPNGFKPSDAVRTMISDGYFSTPQDLASVRTHLKDVLARDVPVTTLSPIFTRLLRSNDLKRKKNTDGNYEYFVPEAN